MGIEYCPNCQRGMMDNESRCPACGVSIMAAKARKTWMRQMKAYAVGIALGVALLGVSMPTLMHRQPGMEPDPTWVALAIAGGLALLGSIFGLALAAFFHHVWKKRTIEQENDA